MRMSVSISVCNELQVFEVRDSSETVDDLVLRIVRRNATLQQQQQQHTFRIDLQVLSLCGCRHSNHRTIPLSGSDRVARLVRRLAEWYLPCRWVALLTLAVVVVDADHNSNNNTNNYNNFIRNCTEWTSSITPRDNNNNNNNITPTPGYIGPSGYGGLLESLVFFGGGGTDAIVHGLISSVPGSRAIADSFFWNLANSGKHQQQ